MLNAELNLLVSGRPVSLDTFAANLVADIRRAVREEIASLSNQPQAKNLDIAKRDDQKTPPLAVSKREAARLLGVSPRTVDNFISLKVIRSVRIGRRVLIPMSSVRNVASNGTSLKRRMTE
jgi:excisionase family DNA binding protein